MPLDIRPRPFESDAFHEASIDLHRDAMALALARPRAMPIPPAAAGGVR